jgi:hypothetical protein
VDACQAEQHRTAKRKLFALFSFLAFSLFPFINPERPIETPLQVVERELTRLLNC